jgi:inner membrane protein
MLTGEQREAMVISSQTASVKAAVLTGIALILLIPLGLLGSLVQERTARRDAAVQSVARGWGDRQWVSGPILAIPITIQSEKPRTVDWYVLPDKLELDVELKVQESRRKLGLYEVPVYVAQVHAAGHFDLARALERLTRGSSAQVHLEQARLLLPVQDPRGLRALKSTEVKNFEPSGGFPMPVLAAPIDLTREDPQGHNIEVTFELAGTQSLQFLPLAQDMVVRARGNWPDPGFTDGFLPVERQIDAQGFKAVWQVLNLNRSYGDRWFEGAINANTLIDSGFGVSLVQPVDIYQRCIRAVKYGGLFIALSFLTLFLVENLQRRRIHPIQYGLMGLALSVFYLLLLAFAEHLGFLAAYAIATTALCSLMGVYLTGALKSVVAGSSSAGVFAATYALLYLLVTSEDYALLAGSIALFALLATTMYLTRKMDWYAQGESLN